MQAQSCAKSRDLDIFPQLKTKKLPICSHMSKNGFHIQKSVFDIAEKVLNIFEKYSNLIEAMDHKYYFYKQENVLIEVLKRSSKM